MSSVNLVSCSNCGVVLDASVLNFPRDICNSRAEVDPSKGTWDNNQQEFVPYVPCPVCASDVLKT